MADAFESLRNVPLELKVTHPWIENKGRCPVQGETFIDVEYRDGTVKYGLAALDEDIDGDYGTDYDYWKFSMADNDIVKWRLHTPEQSLDDAFGDSINNQKLEYPKTNFKPSSEAELRSDEAARVSGLLSDKLSTIADIASKLTRKNFSVADIKLVKDLLESVEEYEENK